MSHSDNVAPGHVRVFSLYLGANFGRRLANNLDAAHQRKRQHTVAFQIASRRPVPNSVASRAASSMWRKRTVSLPDILNPRSLQDILSKVPAEFIRSS
jgi:hypothetical protein